MPVCDGCGRTVDDAHIRGRIERLQLSTRYRPVHIHVLLIDAAPPLRDEDFFYQAASDRSVRSVASRMYFDELAKLAGHLNDVRIEEESVLREFQRRGFFLTYGVECPVEDYAELGAIMRRLAPTVLKRVQASYQPKYVAPLSEPTRELIRIFGLIGWGDRLMLDQGGPFVDPFIGDPQSQAEYGTSLGDRLIRVLSHMP